MPRKTKKARRITVVPEPKSLRGKGSHKANPASFNRKPKPKSPKPHTGRSSSPKDVGGKRKPKAPTRAQSWHQQLRPEILELIIRPKIIGAIATRPTSKNALYEQFQGMTGLSINYETFLEFLSDLGLLPLLTANFNQYVEDVASSVLGQPARSLVEKEARGPRPIAPGTAITHQMPVFHASPEPTQPQEKDYGDPLTNPLPLSIRGPAFPPGGAGTPPPRTNIPSTTGVGADARVPLGVGPTAVASDTETPHID